jgi:hypothetical protein
MTTPFTNFPIPTVLLDTAAVTATGGTTSRTLASHFSDVVNVADFGAVGDGVTDDAPAINAASAYAVANGKTKIIFQAGKTYRLGSSILPRQNLIWDGQGATLLQNTVVANGFFGNLSDTTKTFIGDLTADFVGPSNQLTLTSVAGLSVGSWIAVAIGVNPYLNTPPQTDFIYAVVTQVTAIAGSTITIDWVIPYSIKIGAYTYTPRDPTSPTVAVPACNSAQAKSVFLLQNDFVYNVTFRDFTMIGAAGVDTQLGIHCQWGLQIKCENITANPKGGPLGLTMGAGMIVMQYCRNIRVTNAMCFGNANPTGQLSLGGMMGFANCIDVVDKDHFSQDLWNVVATYEDFCDHCVIQNPVDVVNGAYVAQSGTKANYTAYTFQTGYSTYVMDNPTCITNLPPTAAAGVPQFTNYISTSDAELQIGGRFTWRGPFANYVVPWVRWMDCVLDFNDGTNFATLDFGRTLRYSYRVPLWPNMNVTYYIPSGVMDCDLYCSSNVTPATVTLLLIGLGPISLASALGPGSVANAAARFSALGHGFSHGDISYWIQGLSDGVVVTTSAAAQPAGAFFGISVSVPRVLLSNMGGMSLGNYTTIPDDTASIQTIGTPQQVTMQATTVAGLPAASAANTGFRYLVSDATTTTFGAVVAGTGANRVPVYSDGTNWRIG